MDSTQQDLPIADIKNDIVFLKSGDYALILQTSAVNFGLLSENEQISIIASFAGMLNSLSFPIQILIRSKRLDITTYLKKLDDSYYHQPNPLLAQLIAKYRSFIEKTIRENEVLDKQFYIVVPLWSYEIGVISINSPEQLKKVLNTLIPRRDHLIRQLSGIGLQAKQLKSEELVKLFYDIYNQQPSQPAQTKPLGRPQPATPQVNQPISPTQQTMAAPVNNFRYPPVLPEASPISQLPTTATPRVVNPRAPFVVEELTDEPAVVR